MKHIDEILRKIFAENKIAGMAVAITDKSKIVYSRGFGVDSVMRSDAGAMPDSLYRIASITKLITGMSIMRLKEKGVLELDRPIKEYLPWLELKDEKATNVLTLRHLLSHTAGLPAEYTPEGAREESTLEQSLKDGLPTLKLHALPGDGAYLYSNWGIRLASRVAEVCANKPFSKIAHELIIDPLNMTSTTFDLRTAATYPLSLPHIENEKGELIVYHHINENAARLAAGGLYSNTTDLCKLLRLILNDGISDSGNRIISSQSLAQMKERHSASYGLTMVVRDWNDRIIYGHNGSAPPYATCVATEPECGYGVVILMNTERNELRFKIPEMIFEQLIK